MLWVYIYIYIYLKNYGIVLFDMDAENHVKNYMAFDLYYSTAVALDAKFVILIFIL